MSALPENERKRCSDSSGGSMAHRDRSAGHAFMYVDIKELLQQTPTIKKDAENQTPVAAPTHSTHQFGTSAEQVQGNLERLQALHHKLHAMLEELNKLSGKK
ncbi:MAG: hypothetical protein ACKN9V_01775 [Pseudomonadota bacterium]